MMHPKQRLFVKLVWRELTRSGGFSLFFILNLSLGLLGFAAIKTLKDSVDSVLTAESQAVLTADISVSARRAFDEAELKTLSEFAQASLGMRHERSLFTMVQNAATGTSRLIELKTIDKGFPFYGQIITQNGGALSSDSPKEILEENKVWISKELQGLIGLQVGESLKIGKASFTVSDLVTEAPGVKIGFMAAPLVYIGDKFLEETQLLQLGSRFRSEVFYKVGVGANLAELVTQLSRKLSSSELRIQAHNSASQDTGRAFAVVNDYLSLVALIAVCLASLGSIFLFRSYLTQRYKDVAIILCMGGSHSFSRSVFVSVLIVLCAGATLLSNGLVYLAIPFLPKVFAAFLDQSFVVVYSFRTLLFTFLLSTIGSLLLCWPLLHKIVNLKPIELFKESADSALDFTKTYALHYLPAVIVFAVFCVLQVRSFWIGGLFFAGMILTALILYLVGRMGMLLIKPLLKNRSFVVRMATVYLVRRPAAALTLFLCLAMSAVLLQIIPQIRAVIDDELRTPTGTVLPSLFLFDIQDSQLTGLQKLLAESNLSLEASSPLIRARLERVNNEVLSRPDPNEEAFSREGEWANRMKNRTYNLSYREGLFSSERIISGLPFTGAYVPGTLAELSLEKRFAQRLGLGLGDILEFSVQGSPVKGKVVSIRSIRWNSFQPNFFVSFQPGVLEKAPKSWLAGVPPLGFEEKMEIQKRIVNEFPNISVVDVEQVISRSGEIIEQILFAVTIMAVLCLLAGIGVMVSILLHQARSRQLDASIMKVWGASILQIRSVLVMEFFFLSLFAGFIGGAIGWVLSMTLIRFVFESDNWADFSFVFMSMLLISSLCVIISWVMGRQLFKVKLNDSLKQLHMGG